MSESTTDSAPEEFREEYVVADPEEMHAWGVKLASRLRAGDLLVLTGPLGAGKTTLSRGIGEGLGVRGPVTSPTFVLARTHPSLIGGPALVHVDAYRLQSAVELDDLDIDFERSVVIVEWGAGMVDGITESWLELVIERPTGGTSEDTAESDDEFADDVPEPRTLTLSGYGLRWLTSAWRSEATTRFVSKGGSPSA